MRKIRTTSANWKVRTTYESSTGILMLDRPYPPLGDYEWALRISIDKYFFLQQNNEIQDGGAYSSGLCFATEGLSNLDNQCGGCPIKAKTGKPNCAATPFVYLEKIKTWEEQGDIYLEMMALLQNLYKEMYHQDYSPKVMEDSDVIVSQSKDKASAGSPGGPVCDV